MKKLTKKEMFTQIKAAYENGTFPSDVTDVVAFCDAEIASLDRKAAKAKENAAKKRAEGDALMDAVAAKLTEDLVGAETITAELEADGIETSKQKVIYRLNKLVEAGVAEKAQINVAAEGEKARKIMAYKLA